MCYDSAIIDDLLFHDLLSGSIFGAIIMNLFVHGRLFELRLHRSLERNDLSVTKDQCGKIQRSLSAVPPEHLTGLQYVEIRQREGAGGSSNPLHCEDTSTGDQYFIVLDIDCFSKPWNNRPHGLLYTLLHEMGHVRDWRTRAFDWVRRNDRDGYSAIIARTHRGRTQHNQEKFADCYADIFTQTDGFSSTDPALVACRNSPAFSPVGRAAPGGV